MTDTSGVVPTIEGDRTGGPWVELWGDWLYRIYNGFHLTRVLMDGDSSLNVLYQDTVRKMGIDPSRIKPTKRPLKASFQA